MQIWKLGVSKIWYFIPHFKFSVFQIRDFWENWKKYQALTECRVFCWLLLSVFLKLAHSICDPQCERIYSVVLYFPCRDFCQKCFLPVCVLLSRLLTFCFIKLVNAVQKLYILDSGGWWFLHVAKNHFEAFISRRGSPSTPVIYWLLQSLQGELQSMYSSELNCALTWASWGRDAAVSAVKPVDSWGTSWSLWLVQASNEIQVLQIVKELVTPSRQRAARA